MRTHRRHFFLALNFTLNLGLLFAIGCGPTAEHKKLKEEIEAALKTVESEGIKFDADQTYLDTELKEVEEKNAAIKTKFGAADSAYKALTKDFSKAVDAHREVATANAKVVDGLKSLAEKADDGSFRADLIKEDFEQSFKALPSLKTKAAAAMEAHEKVEHQLEARYDAILATPLPQSAVIPTPVRPASGAAKTPATKPVAPKRGTKPK